MSTTPQRSERERMLAGEPYRSDDPDLLRRRARGRDLTARYDATRQRAAPSAGSIVTRDIPPACCRVVRKLE